MTYISIREAINDLQKKGELVSLESEFFGEETPRAIFVSREVAELVLGEWPEGRDNRLAANSRALLDDFVEGGYVTVGEDPFDKQASCILARVHPVEKQLFDFRCLAPNPGIRILGAFAEPNVFVALTWDYRDNFDDCWPEHVAECESEWRRLFGEIPPYSGRDINAYITSNARAV